MPESSPLNAGSVSSMCPSCLPNVPGLLNMPGRLKMCGFQSGGRALSGANLWHSRSTECRKLPAEASRLPKVPLPLSAPALGKSDRLCSFRECPPREQDCRGQEIREAISSAPKRRVIRVLECPAHPRCVRSSHVAVRGHFSLASKTVGNFPPANAEALSGFI